MNRAEDLEVAGRTVLVRADLNVPLAIGAGLRAMGPGGSPPGQESAPPDQHRITDDTRIRASLPTIRDLLARRAGIVVVPLGPAEVRAHDHPRSAG